MICNIRRIGIDELKINEPGISPRSNRNILRIVEQRACGAVGGGGVDGGGGGDEGLGGASGDFDTAAIALRRDAGGGIAAAALGGGRASEAEAAVAPEGNAAAIAADQRVGGDDAAEIDFGILSVADSRVIPRRAAAEADAAAAMRAACGEMHTVERYIAAVAAQGDGAPQRSARIEHARAEQPCIRRHRDIAALPSGAGGEACRIRRAARHDAGLRAVDIATARRDRHRAARTGAAVGDDRALLRDVAAGDADGAAVASRHIQRAGQVHHAAAAVGTCCADNDRTLCIAYTLRPQRAAVGDEAVDDVGARRRGQRNRAAIGLDGAGVAHQLRTHRITHRHRHQPVAIEIHRRGVATGQVNAAQLRRDYARVHHVRRHEADQPRILCRNRPRVGNRRARIARRAEH